VAIRLEDLLASFRRHLRAAAKTPRTIELYSQSVRYFARWLTDRGREPVLEELTRHAVAAWLAELADTCEPSTVGTRLRGMRRFCRWLVAEGELEVAPTDGIEIPAPPEKPVPILTDEEIAALLKACTVPRGRPGVFDRVVFLGRRDELVLRLQFAAFRVTVSFSSSFADCKKYKVAQRTVTRLVDDLDGTEIQNGSGQTVSFGLDGQGYEINLTNENAEGCAKPLPATPVPGVRSAAGAAAAGLLPSRLASRPSPPGRPRVGQGQQGRGLAARPHPPERHPPVPRHRN
jgi:hypothetical protein